MENQTKKRAILEFNTFILAEILQLPKGAEIVMVEISIDQPDVISILVEGVGWESSDGEYVVRTSGTCKTISSSLTPNKVIEIEYEFPKE